MAGTFSRILDIFRSKANKALDKMEDPRDTLDLSYEKQLEQLQKVRRGVADVATARKRIELQAQGLQKQADKLQGQAKAALQQGNEDLAREALARRAALGEQLTELKTQHDQISEQEQKLVQTSQELQSRVERFRTQKETMKASYTAAEAQTKVGEAVSGISDSTRSAGATMQRAQDKIAGMQARAGAIDELLASGALDDLTQPVDDIQKELDKVSSTSQVDNELAALKAELGTGDSAPDATAALPDGRAGRNRNWNWNWRRKRLMAISRNIKPDRGLTYRMLMTGFFLVLLYGLVVGILIAIGLQFAVVLVIAFALIFCQYWFSAKIAMYAMHAKEVTPEQAPELHGVVDRLCALADMPKPKVAIATTDIPNAFATGRSPKSAVVCVTSGLLRRLDEPEVEAVLSHELSHVAHRDVAVMTIASGLGMIAGLMTRVMFYSEIFGGGRGGGNNQQSQAALVEMIVLLVSVVVYFISFLLTMALSRYRELAADRSGALLIGRPSLLASALIKITGEMGKIPTKDLRSAEPFNAFFFTPAVANGATQGGGGGFSFGQLFRTHPTLEKRLAQLQKIEQQLGQAS